MAKYRKKPVVIEAVPVIDVLSAASRRWQDLPEWVADAYERGDLVIAAQALHIRTLEGTMIGGMNDWLIKGVKNEIYPCKYDVFAATYEPAEG